jgi:hypothetical protein
VSALALALLALASGAAILAGDGTGAPGTLKTIVRKLIDPNISGGHNFIAKWEVAELVKELFVSDHHVGALATLREVHKPGEVPKIGYSDTDIIAICKEFARIDRTDSEQLCALIDCWPPKRR